MTTATTPIFGTQTVQDLAQWLIAPADQAAFASLDRYTQLLRLAARAHAKREYIVRDVCRRTAHALCDRA